MPIINTISIPSINRASGLAGMRYQADRVLTTGNDDELCINIETMSNRSNPPGEIRQIPTNNGNSSKPVPNKRNSLGAENNNYYSAATRWQI